MNTLNIHTPHDCPTTHPYSPPLPVVWIVSTSEGDRILTGEQVSENPALTNNGERADWEQMDDTHDCHRPVWPAATPFSIDFIDIGETIASGLKTAYDAVMRQVCTETGQFLTENLAGLAVTVLSGGNAYIGIGASIVVHKVLEADCSQRRSSYGTHQNSVLSAGCTSDGSFTASAVAGMAINYRSTSNAKTIYEYLGSLFAGEFLESACEQLSTDPDATITPPAPFRTPTPTPTPTPEPTPVSVYPEGVDPSSTLDCLYLITYNSRGRPNGATGCLSAALRDRYFPTIAENQRWQRTDPWD